MLPLPNLAVVQMENKNKKGKYSDLQLDRLRNALRVFYQYEYVEDYNYYEAIEATEGIDDEDRRERNKKKKENEKAKMRTSMTWADVHNVIADLTGVEVGKVKDKRKKGNTLQKFVEGVKDLEILGQKKPYVPKTESIDAIVSFLTHEDIDLLSQDEFKEFVPGVQAPLRLLEYFNDTSIERGSVLSSHKVFQYYEAEKVIEDEFIFVRLIMKHSSNAELFQVTVIEDYYETEAIKSIYNWSASERLDNRNSSVIYGGWMVLSPEGNFIFFLKNEQNGMNKSFVTLASDLARCQSLMRYLVVLSVDYPLELGAERRATNQEIMTQVDLEMAQNVMLFRSIL